MSLRVEVVGGISAVPREAWNALRREEDAPFSAWEWLDVLESSCAVPSTGWTPAHFTFWRGTELVAAAPTYIKTNSDGEQIFDEPLPELYRSAGAEYYPRLVTAIPGTPVESQRLLHASSESLEEITTAFVSAARDYCVAKGLSSANVLYPTKPEITALVGRGFLRHVGYQAHWVNHGYASWQDFMDQFEPKARRELQKERRDFAKLGIRVQTLRGVDIPRSLLPLMQEAYVSTCNTYEHGTFANLAFFERAYERVLPQLELVVAHDKDGFMAGQLHIAHRSIVYARHWGSMRDAPGLRFNVGLHHPIEDSIQRGVAQIHGGGLSWEHKFRRGFEPALTQSAHWFRDPGIHETVGQWLVGWIEEVEQKVRDLRANSRLRAVRSSGA